jgi:ABC-type nitrate/sulfonate/bicarbonate transport system substrate-binding protein
MKRFTVLAGLVVVVVAVMAGQVLAAAKQVNLCVPAEATAIVYVVAAENKLFDKYGIQGTAKPFADGNVALDSLLTGQCDVGVTSEAGGLVRRAKGGKVYLMGEVQSSKTLIGIVAFDSIKKPADLMGKKVAYPVGSGAHIFFGQYVAYHRLDASKIAQVNLDTPDALAVLRRRDVDALFIWEPHLSRAVDAVPGVRIFGRIGDDNIGMVTSYIYFGERVFRDMELRAGVLKALIEAQQRVNANREQAIKLLVGTMQLSPEVVKQNMDHYVYEVKWGPDTRRKIEHAARFLKDQGRIGDIDWSAYLHPEILKEVAPDRVKGE